MIHGRNKNVFFELLRGGLWEKEVRLSQYKEIDFSAIMQLAEEQSVVGLITAGLEKVFDVKVPQEVLLQFVGKTLQIEQRNQAMNSFLTRLINLLRDNDVYALLVKGQGIAQCYEKPLCRACGDIDLLLDSDNYEKAKAYLVPIADNTETELRLFKHFGMTINGWIVELHGTLCPRLTRGIDKIVENIQLQSFQLGKVRTWKNCDSEIFIPAPDDDMIFLFTHLLQHFYEEGVGLRQICDICRFLWVYNDSLDKSLLEKRLYDMGIVAEWKSFAALYVDYLDMPVDAIPFYSSESRWKKKSQKICEYVLKVGNFGHNKVSVKSYRNPLMKKIMSLVRRTTDSLQHFFIFPRNTVLVWFHMLLTGVLVVSERKIQK